jgi:hypothetical protein
MNTNDIGQHDFGGDLSDLGGGYGFRHPPSPPPRTGSLLELGAGVIDLAKRVHTKEADSFEFAKGVLKLLDERKRTLRNMRNALAYETKKRDTTAERVALLNPNENSDVKVGAFVFSLNPSQFSTGDSLHWGELNGWTAFKNPTVAFSATRVSFNVAFPGLVYVNTLQIANINAEIGGASDAWCLNGKEILLPCLPPQNTMQVTGTWTNLIDTRLRPPKASQESDNGLEGTVFILAITFTGWATIIA